MGRYSRTDPLGLRAGLNLYHYAISNPSGHLDFNGRFGLDPSQIWPFMCSAGFASEGKELGKTRGWPWAHCWTSCSIATFCGGSRLARAMGLGKELLDVSKCFGEIFSGRPIDPNGNCGSAFQPSDFEDNEFGISCPQGISCEERCAPLVDKNPDPGPMFLIAIGAQHYLTL